MKRQTNSFQDSSRSTTNNLLWNLPIRNLLSLRPWLRKERTATGSTISYHGQKYQLVDEKSSILSLPSKSVIQVLRHLDDSIDAMYRGKRYGLCEFNPAPKPELKLEAREKQQVSRKPNPDNPWLNFKLPPKVDDPVEQYFEKRNWRLRQIHQNYKED